MAIFREYHANAKGPFVITEDQIKDAVLHSRSWIQRQGTHGGVKWAFEKLIGGDTLRVAGEIKGNTIYVITAFWVGR